jgi:hypothetical protein
MNIIQELEKIALQKDPETQQKIIAIKEQLTPLLQQSSSTIAIERIYQENWQKVTYDAPWYGDSNYDANFPFQAQ